MPCQSIEHKTKINIPRNAYPNHYNDIPHGSRDHVIVPDNVKNTFNPDLEYTNK